MKIFTAEQMRELDRLTVEQCGISPAMLMETAAHCVIEAINERYGPIKHKRFAVYCGKGNNGGDGAAIARLLWVRGALEVHVLLFGRIADTRSETRANFEAVKRIAAYEAVEEAYPRFHFRECEAQSNGKPLKFLPVDVVVDALLGTGLTRPASGPYAQAIELINEPATYRRRVVAVDIPSGLPSDGAHPIGPHVRADLTVSFTAPKPGNVLPPACYANGELVVARIGTPSQMVSEADETGLVLVEEFRAQLPLWMSHRTVEAHKGSVGDVLLIAGSYGKTGAAALASAAVLRAGAGLVTVATARSAQPLLVAQCKTEVMTEGLDENEAGAITHTALERALQLAATRTVLALGPGLSAGDENTRRFVREFVEQRTSTFKGPLVIDADGLNALAPWPDELKGSKEFPLIITPHPGEMARLTGKSTAEILADRLAITRTFALHHHVVTVLKGNRTLIAAPNGQVFINPTGNAGMATAGAGDVLTGLLAGLLAQKTAQGPQDALGATIAAVYLHGLAGDLAAAKLGQRSLLASDIIEHLSEAILQVGGASECKQPASISRI